MVLLFVGLSNPNNSNSTYLYLQIEEISNEIMYVFKII